MADVLRPGYGSRDFWPVDKIILAYAAFSTTLLVGWYHRIPGAGYSAGAARGRHRSVDRRGQVSQSHQLGFPQLVSGPLCRVMLQRDGAVCPRRAPWRRRCLARATRFPHLARQSHRLAGADPDAGAFRIPTDCLHALHSGGTAGLCAPVEKAALPGVPILWFFNRARLPGVLCRLPDGPGAGPAFLPKTFTTHTVTGTLVVPKYARFARPAGIVAYDCFPSGHTELTLLAWWGSRLVSNRLFKVYFAYTPALIFATVYLRYHYTVDVLAGAVVAAGLIPSTPVIYKKLSKGGFTRGRS